MTEVRNLAELGGLLRAARKAQRLTQHDVMFAANVSKTFVIDVEHGKPTCEFDKVMRVAEAVGVQLLARRRAGVDE